MRTSRLKSRAWRSRERLGQYSKQLYLESAFGKFAVDVVVAAEVPSVDVLWVTVKATQLESALTALKNPDGVRAIVPLLNGIDHVALPVNMRSSMQKDVKQHKAPELDAIAGPILRGDRRHGIEVPATKKLVAAVEERAGVESRLA